MKTWMTRGRLAGLVLALALGGAWCSATPLENNSHGIPEVVPGNVGDGASLSAAHSDAGTALLQQPDAANAIDNPLSASVDNLLPYNLNDAILGQNPQNRMLQSPNLTPEALANAGLQINYDFTTGVSMAVPSFVYQNQLDTGIGENVKPDDVSISIVPEPATMALLGAGLLALAYRQRRGLGSGR
jgi:hypothetical protein